MGYETPAPPSNPAPRPLPGHKLRAGPGRNLLLHLREPFILPCINPLSSTRAGLVPACDRAHCTAACFDLRTGIASERIPRKAPRIERPDRRGRLADHRVGLAGRSPRIVRSSFA